MEEDSILNEEDYYRKLPDPIKRKISGITPSEQAFIMETLFDGYPPKDAESFEAAFFSPKSIPSEERPVTFYPYRAVSNLKKAIAGFANALKPYGLIQEGKLLVDNALAKNLSIGKSALEQIAYSFSLNVAKTYHSGKEEPSKLVTITQVLLPRKLYTFGVHADVAENLAERIKMLGDYRIEFRFPHSKMQRELGYNVVEIRADYPVNEVNPNDLVWRVPKQLVDTVIATTYALENTYRGTNLFASDREEKLKSVYFNQFCFSALPEE